jgi:hypothetical protein
MATEWDKWRTALGLENRRIDHLARSRARSRLQQMFPEQFHELVEEERKKLGYKRGVPGRRLDARRVNG